jgi:EAL domain-containing protein (putative c-di-GMP-specific phosphodiesterase class I)
MYRAKVSGRNRFEVFDPRTPLDEGADAALETALRSALDGHQLRLAYQPMLALGDRQVLGFEALLRWDHPERGTLNAADFLPTAEARGLIVPIGEWVLDTACSQLAAWTTRRHATATPLTIAVNVSGRQLREPRFAKLVSETLDRHRIASRQVCLEIAERDLTADDPATRETLTALAALGIQLAVDNFGATYASLARLPQFPVSVVKLEQFSESPRSRRLGAMVVAMAHGLGMRVVGQRIETPTQLNDLEEITCDDGQGYLLSPPMSPENVDRMLEDSASTHPVDPDEVVPPRDVST